MLALTHSTDPDADDEAQVACLALNVWAELRFNPDLRDRTSPAYEYLHTGITKIAKRWQREGRLRDGLDSESIGTMIWKFTLGFIAVEVVSADTNLGSAAALNTLILNPTPKHADARPSVLGANLS